MPNWRTFRFNQDSLRIECRLTSVALTRIKIVALSCCLSNSLVSHSWQGLKCARHDSNHSFVKAEGRKEEKRKREEDCMHVQREGMFFCPLHPVQFKLSCRRLATNYSHFHLNLTAPSLDYTEKKGMHDKRFPA